jgi:hypothetical protein
MRKQLFVATLGVMASAAIAQMSASSSVYLLDIDPARYAGPAGQRLAVVLNDEPRLISLSAQDEICVQLRSQDPANPNAQINALVRVLKPERQSATNVRVFAPDISPGTFRATPSGLLLRLVADRGDMVPTATPVGLANAPVCSLEDGGTQATVAAAPVK